MLRTLLIISLSINVFVFSSLAMYGVWLVSGSLLDAFWRGVTSLFVWMVTFGAGTVAFWRIIVKFSQVEGNLMR